MKDSPLRKEQAAKRGTSRNASIKNSAIKSKKRKIKNNKGAIKESLVIRKSRTKKVRIVEEELIAKSAVVKSAAVLSAGALAVLVEQTESDLRAAGATLHNEIAPLLVAAGLRLQLLRMDHPQTADQVNSVLTTIDHAMERVRTLSQQLNPSPVYAIATRPRS